MFKIVLQTNPLSGAFTATDIQAQGNFRFLTETTISPPPPSWTLKG